jgi:hypothetical protein
MTWQNADAEPSKPSHPNNHVLDTLGAQGANVKGLLRNPTALYAPIQNV